MKKFSLSSVASVQALRPSLIELHGYRIALAGVASCEPLMRGCDQQVWLEQLVRLGIRHLVLPLNGPEEDTCLYARRHPAGADAGSSTIYDLGRRDEG
ncbi:MAG: hypothetical protein NTW87_31310, partial [Planctomycetota bacterium]|nr:hypothetical protein [Planctomycetota bacterium]